MKEYSAEQLRTVVLASHQGAGKTSLAEAMLFDTGVTTRLGKVDDGTTASDWDPDEIQHKISISNTVLPIEWKDTKINFIDTPGYADFVGEVRAGVRVADPARWSSRRLTVLRWERSRRGIIWLRVRCRASSL